MNCTICSVECNQNVAQRGSVQQACHGIANKYVQIVPVSGDGESFSFPLFMLCPSDAGTLRCVCDAPRAHSTSIGGDKVNHPVVCLQSSPPITGGGGVCVLHPPPSL